MSLPKSTRVPHPDGVTNRINRTRVPHLRDVFVFVAKVRWNKNRISQTRVPHLRDVFAFVAKVGWNKNRISQTRVPHLRDVFAFVAKVGWNKNRISRTRVPHLRDVFVFVAKVGTTPHILSFVAALLCLSASAGARHAPDPSFKALDGQSRKLSSMRGQVVVVNFWATWCGPCQEELPRLSKIAESYAGKPVHFVLISIDEPRNRPKIPAVLDRLHVSLETWDDADTDTMDRFGLGNIVPGTAILDEKGEVVARIMGEAREEDVRKAVDWLLGGNSGPAPPTLTKRY